MYQETLEEVIVKMLPVINVLARKYLSPYQNLVTHEDLVSAGVIGLIKAYRRYSPEKFKNVKFESYASHRIKGEMFDELRKFFKIKRKPRSNDNGRKRKTKLTVQAINSFTLYEYEKEDENEYSTFYYFHTNSGGSFHYEILKSELEAFGFISEHVIKDPFEVYAQKELEEKLQEAMNLLTEREKLIIKLYYYENVTFKEIANLIGYAEGRISQIHKKAILKMKNYIFGNTQIYQPQTNNF